MHAKAVWAHWQDHSQQDVLSCFPDWRARQRRQAVPEGLRLSKLTSCPLFPASTESQPVSWGGAARRYRLLFYKKEGGWGRG